MKRSNPRKEISKKELTALGKYIYDELDKGLFPKMSFKSRSVRNMKYDEEALNQYLQTKTIHMTVSEPK